MYSDYHVEFLTATILNWQKLMQDDNCKNIELNSMRWLVTKNRCKIFAFVIMPNHLHLLWQIASGFERKGVQGALLNFTAHEFKKCLNVTNPDVLLEYFVNAADRSYQFWKRDPMIKECWSHHFFMQKLDYVHYNPCQPGWNLARVPEEYFW